MARDRGGLDEYVLHMGGREIICGQRAGYRAFKDLSTPSRVASPQELELNSSPLECGMDLVAHFE